MFSVLHVTSVDLDSRTAKCLRESDRAPILNVRWFSGFGTSGHPSPRDRCMAMQVESTWWLMGRLDYVTSSMVYPSNSLGSSGPITARDYSSGGTGTAGATTGTALVPDDALPGDHIIGGGIRGLVAAMLGGSVVIKAGALCLGYFSKLSALIRFVSRRYEQYSDASRQVQANCDVFTYKYQESYYRQSDMRNSLPAYTEAAGNVRVALANKFSWQGSTVPVGDDDKVRWRQSVAGFSRKLDTDGTETVITGVVTTVTTAADYTVTAGNASVKVENGKVTVKIGTENFVFTAASLKSDSADVIADTVGLQGHVHGGVMAGSSSTDAPTVAP